MVRADRTQPLVPSFELELNGTVVGKEIAGWIVNVTVEDELNLPGMFAFELASREDERGTMPWTDDTRFQLGMAVRVGFGYGSRSETVLSGEITALEPRFSSSGPPTLTVRGYDKRHRLNTVRRTRTEDGRVYTLADTVGFVRALPHQLVEAFRSTLEEVGDADLLLHVVDVSHPDPEGQIAAVRHVLADLPGVEDVPEVVVLNKADVADPEVVDRIRRKERRTVVVSAHTGEGVEALRALIADSLPRPDVAIDVVVPYSRGDLVHRVHTEGEIDHEEHTPEGTLLRGRVAEALAAELAGAASGD